MSKKINTVLLGGSNSIMNGALKAGLSFKSDLTNIAMGASSVVQNASELSKSRAAIINSDLVITESNVNDSHNVNVLDLPINYMLERISEFYSELYKLNKRCVVLILPVKHLEGKTESLDVIQMVNQAHRANAIKYQFYIVDLAMHFSKLSKEVIDMLMPDPRHVNNSYMYNLGINVINYITSLKLSTTNNVNLNIAESRYSFLDASLFGKVEKKRNSMFEVELLELREGDSYKFKKSAYGHYIIGIATWSDGNSAIKITNKYGELKKCFNNLNAFNEVSVPIKIDDSTKFNTIKLDIEKTEESVNVKDFTNCKDNTKLAGFYISKDLEVCNITDIYAYDKNGDYDYELDFLIPDSTPYFHSIKFFLSRVSMGQLVNFKYKNFKGDASSFYANFTKDVAVFFINKDIKLAYKLMRLALFINPNNQLAKKWIKNQRLKNK
ncbi:hypothetical protein Q4596_09470 [Pseudoalteromonas carrageenovora]|uniref:hypothetical protein n=1 Tax=Pseudoalteromonas carrageenovora TaxID=227 RepID=UPI0026E37D95|nr:hypothetical protein [Pseudoalteromonas carrageenovora]MDO6835853.1 hypothetical protein [Pseudoalteromonas carrageenovora]